METRNSRLNVLLFALLGFGIGSILLNYLLSMLKVRQVVRSVIGIRLVEYERQLRRQLRDREKSVEKSLGELENNVTVAEAQIKQVTEEVLLISSDIQYSLNLYNSDTYRSLKRETKRMKRQLIRDLKEHFKIAKKERADANSQP